jgi:hypothetical protein
VDDRANRAVDSPSDTNAAGGHSAEQGPAISNFFASGTTVGERLAAFTVEPGEKTPLSFICRRLVSDPTMKTVDIADCLHWNG